MSTFDFVIRQLEARIVAARERNELAGGTLASVVKLLERELEFFKQLRGDLTVQGGTT